jgi:hypothetical protein
MQTKVFNTNTMEELIFNLPAKEALIQAYQQSKGIFDLGKRASQFPIKSTGRGLTLGNFWTKGE